MLKNKNEQIQSLIRLGDVFICVFSFFITILLRSSPLLKDKFGQLPEVENLTWMLAASIVIHILLYPAMNFYGSLRLKSTFDIIFMTLKAFFLEFLILGTLVFLFQIKDTSRLFFGLFILINYSLILIERVGARTLLTQVRRRGLNFRQVLIVGTGKNAEKVIETLKRNKHWGYMPFGLLRVATVEKEQARDVLGVPVIGILSDFGDILRSRAVDEVYFAPESFTPELYEQEASLCETLGIPVRFSLYFLSLPHSQVSFNFVDRLPVITYYRTMMTPLQFYTKRFIDILVSCIGLIITVLLYPWIAYRIKKQSSGAPIIFKQVRVGENGRHFKCYKFRTMYADAEDRKKELIKLNKMEGPIFKVENDPRIFPFGHFLRKTSLDELPQFFNILRGDMSVVGTRPPTPDEVIQYKDHYRRRLSIRPGLTGLWQVSGRNNISKFEDILALDLKYIDEWSLTLDFRIILKTFFVFLFGRGAH